MVEFDVKDFRDRIQKAIAEVENLRMKTTQSAEVIRLRGKLDGIRLTLGYLDEELRSESNTMLDRIARMSINEILAGLAVHTGDARRILNMDHCHGPTEQYDKEVTMALLHRLVELCDGAE